MSLVGSDFYTDRERPERARSWFGLSHELVVPPRGNANRQARAVAFGKMGFAPWVEGSLKAPPELGWPGLVFEPPATQRMPSPAFPCYGSQEFCAPIC